MSVDRAGIHNKQCSIAVSPDIGPSAPSIRTWNIAAHFVGHSHTEYVRHAPSRLLGEVFEFGFLLVRDSETY